MKYLTISPTSFDNLQECLAKLYFRKQRKIVYPKDNTHMQMGHLGHKGLEHHYNLKKQGIHGLELIERVAMLLREDSLKYETLTGEDKLTIFEAVRDYQVHYIGEIWDPVDIEKPFSKELTTIPELDLTIVLEGKIDLRYSQDGIPRPADHKFKWQKYPLSSLKNQYMAYAVACDSPTMVDNSIYLYKKGAEFVRTVFSYDKERKEEWVRETVPYHVKRLIASLESGFWPQSWSACNNMGGCSYRSICEVPKSIREAVIKDDYVPNESEDLYD